jgi:glycerophosphoryl diester phosphodiesterase
MAPGGQMKILCLVLAGPLACGATTTSDLRSRLNALTLVVGAHRGGVYRFVPNTMNQFQYARGIGVDVIETDLRSTQDGVPVVVHDNTLSAGTRCSGAVNSKTLEELRECPLKWWALRQPTFEEVLQRMDGEVVLDAEFKETDVIEPAIDLVRRYHAYGSVYFQATSKAKYEFARAYDRDVALLFSPQDQAELDWALGLEDNNLVVIELHENIRTQANIDRIHRAGILASENAWHFGGSLPNPREFFWADCADVYAHGIDIAISENPTSCLRERAQVLLARASTTRRPQSAVRSTAASR